MTDQSPDHVSPDKDITFKGYFNGVINGSVIYSWTTSPALANAMMTYQLDDTFIIYKGALTPGAQYSVILTIKSMYGSSSFVQDIFVNTRPIPGPILFTPNTGQAVITSIQISTADWTNYYPPLKYQFGFYKALNDVGNPEKLTILKEMSTSSVAIAKFPSLGSSDTYIVSVIVEDFYGTRAEKTQNLTLDPLVFSSWVELAEEIASLIQNSYSLETNVVSDLSLCASLISHQPTANMTDADLASQRFAVSFSIQSNFP